jgi:aryl-alcohol dehydrogenase-like predicted oxidoreductase
MTMPQMVLRHILEHPAVSTVIPGMRKIRHVEQNVGVSDGVRLAPALLQELKGHRWERTVDWE